MSRGLSFAAYRILSAGQNLWANERPRHQEGLRCGAGAIIFAMLLGVAGVLPGINADAGPPRSVFLELPTGEAVPEIMLMPYRLPSGRWQLQIRARDFRFTTLCVADAQALAVGHAHIVRNGVKVASAYHPIVDLGWLPPGRHRITVILRGQDHRALIADGALVQAKVTIAVPAA
ncbi:hypothetical protein [Actibacterium sp. 188UL27-1]|uniref:hypothetical protein n=1 Tax=Actibacterium sp. 188UL27-1 TaxID=2786961 RepID=UPI0019590B04|nr:hypothetical protein [Actibacterium sp. 188UL27-1]MBM7066915.1 hypothetical protein [Actibacterium sp. 188UL27-1]